MSTSPVSTPLVLLSPHRDDAAFSASRLLLEAARVSLPTTLLNVFTRSAYAPFHPLPLSAEEISHLRLTEDQNLLKQVGSHLSLLDLGLLDAPLRLGIPDTSVLGSPLPPDQLQAEIARTATSFPAVPDLSLVALPLAIGQHIDHRIARDAARSVVSPGRLLFYQDLPYACRITAAELAAETTAILSMLALDLQPFLLRSASAAEDKARLAACYPSQIAPETIAEMTHWTASHSGELFFATGEATQALMQLLPGADLLPIPGLAA